MATVASNQLTFFDAAKLHTSDGKMITVAELFQQQNGLHQDFEWVESDTAAGHLSAQRTSLPDVFDKVANEGVDASKSTVAQILESPQRLEGWSKIEDDVARHGGNIGAKKADQDSAFVEQMIQTWHKRVLYGNGASSPGQIDGIMKRYGTKAGQAIGKNILLAKTGAGTDYASILLIGHGRSKAYAFYPKGSPAGLEMEDFGREHMTVSGKEVVQHSKRFTWAFGLAFDNPYYVVRIANVDLSDLKGGSPPDLILLMQQALSLLPSRKNCRPAFYVSPTVEFWLQRQAYLAVKSGAGGLGMMNVAGEEMMAFQGVPINRLEQLSEAETEVT